MRTKRGTAYLDETADDITSLAQDFDFGFVACAGPRAFQSVFLNRLFAKSKDDLLKGIHAAKLRAAFAGRVQQYNWSDITKSAFYQTTVFPLPATSKKPLVLIMVREIKTAGASPKTRETFLREGPGHPTVAQLLLAAREEEKRKIAKALHDELGSTAVILTSLLTLVRSQLNKNQKAQAMDHLQKLDEQIKLRVERMKNIVVSLRPPSLEQYGALCGFIGELLENTCKYANIPYTYDCEESCEKGVSDNVKITLYRVVQEALNNIVKHAKAKHIWVTLQREKGVLYLRIKDDGVGFVKTRHQSVRRMGLLAMKESVRLLGGTLTIKSTLGKGTCIKVTCPCVVYEDNL